MNSRNEPPIIPDSPLPIRRARRWMVILALLLMLFLAVFWMRMNRPTAVVQNEPAASLAPSPPPPAAPPIAQELPPVPATPEPEPGIKLEDFIGRWTGAWDKTWNVEFTFEEVPEAPGQLVGIYEWAENIGRPRQRMRVSARLTNDVLNVRGAMIQITRSKTNPDRARAIGNFKVRRVADLKRQ